MSIPVARAAIHEISTTKPSFCDTTLEMLNLSPQVGSHLKSKKTYTEKPLRGQHVNIYASEPNFDAGRETEEYRSSKGEDGRARPDQMRLVKH